jgi:hypothetical protein
VRVGEILNIAKELTKISKTAKAYEIVSELEKLSRRYSLSEKDESDEKIELKIDIILSESFVS